MGYSGAGGKLIREKNQKQKISWHCPFNQLIVIHNYTILTILRCFYNYLYPMQGHSKSKSFMQCGGSGMFIPDPDFYPSRIRIPDLRSRIPDPKTEQKSEVKKNLLSYFFL